MSLDMLFLRLNMGVGGAVLLATVLLAAEAGFRVGRRVGKNTDDRNRSHYTAIEGTAMAVAGLLLGFTFSMSASRFESRKLIVVNEANAIGTAYLRARLLESPQRQEVEAGLRRYVDLWLEMHDAGPDMKRSEAARREMDQIQERIWATAAEAARRDPNAVTKALLLGALNDVFDRQSELVAAVANRVPGLVLLLVVVASTISLGMVGYGSGLAGRRSFAAVLALGALLVVIIVTVLDFDRPRRGVVQIGSEPMLAVRQSMNAGGS